MQDVFLPSNIAGSLYPVRSHWSVLGVSHWEFCLIGSQSGTLSAARGALLRGEVCLKAQGDEHARTNSY